MMQKEWKVLLIDDDPGIRKVMAITLEDAGYQVLTAEDGMSGVELCRRKTAHRHDRHSYARH